MKRFAAVTLMLIAGCTFESPKVDGDDITPDDAQPSTCGGATAARWLWSCFGAASPVAGTSGRAISAAERVFSRYFMAIAVGCDRVARGDEPE